LSRSNYIIDGDPGGASRPTSFVSRPKGSDGCPAVNRSEVPRLRHDLVIVRKILQSALVVRWRYL
jgi:hypothetical protein